MSTRNLLRQSQIITTFGPGAMVDLPTRSVLIAGLDHWQMPKDGYREIVEPVLARRMEQWLRKHDRLDEGQPIRLLSPPLPDAGRPGTTPGVEAMVFPTWFVCDRIEHPKIRGRDRRGRRLVRWSDLDPGGGRKKFRHEDGGKDEVWPLRFVGGCEVGHLQDVEWRGLVHSGETCHEAMWLIEEGTSANLADLEIACSCGRQLSLKDASKPGRLGMCDGRQPWLSSHIREDCGNKLRLLTRSATNAYFPNVDKVISLPEAEDELTRIVERNWNDLESARNVDEIGIFQRGNSALRMELEGYSDEAVFERIQDLKIRSSSESVGNPRVREFDMLASGRPEIGVNEPASRLYAETLDRDAWAEDAGRDLTMIQNLVVIHRLREVMCLYGFTRFEPAPTQDDDDEDIGLAVSGAPISSNGDWLPAIEQFGEGLFLHFDPGEVRNWLNRPEVSRRIEILHRGFAVHRQKFPNSVEKRPRSGSYIFLHSLSHALINEISLECGYPASSLKERIYDIPAQVEAESGYGILIYTASTGAEGTLGGLVATAKRFSRILDRALDRLVICSNDPVCADHEPGSVFDDRALLGAACHGCLLIAETSCESRNQFLDRSLLVPTIAETGSAMW